MDDLCTLLLHRDMGFQNWHGRKKRYFIISHTDKTGLRAQRLINLEIPVLVQSLKSNNVELG